MMKALLHPKLLLMLVVFLLALLVVFNIIYVGPLEKNVASLEKELVAKRGKKLALQSSTASLEKLHGQYLQEKDNMAIFVQDVLGTKAKRLPALQTFLRQVSRKYHMEPDKIPFAFVQEESELGQLIQLNSSLDLSGGYANLKKLIEEIYGRDHFLMVNSLAIKSETEAGNQLKIKVGLETYFLDIERPLDPPVKAVDSPVEVEDNKITDPVSEDGAEEPVAPESPEEGEQA